MATTTDTIDVRDIDFTPCEREAIHLFGRVQSHGTLLVCQAAAPHAVVQASQEAADRLRRTAAAGAPLADWLGEEGARAVAYAAGSLGDATGEARLLRIDGGGGPMEARVLRSDGHLIVELVPLEEDGPPVTSDPADDGAAEITAALEGAADHVVLGAARLAGRVSRHLGYDRVMVYRFAPDWCGEVVAEERADGMVPYLGLRYPATDIPSQARRLYLENRVRQIVDARDEGTPLAPPTLPGATRPVDLGQAKLRTVSPYHLEYLRNMGVRATIVSSIVVEGRLWGLVACHHLAPRRVGFAAMRWLEGASDRFAAHVAAVERRRAEGQARRRERDRARIVEHVVAVSKEPPDRLARALLLGSFRVDRLAEADASALVVGDTVWVSGDGPDPDWTRRFAAWQAAHGPALFTSDAIGDDRPDDPPPDDETCGVLGRVLRRDPLLWMGAFRHEVTREVHWGGDPNEPVERGPGDRLSPRRSFDLWRQVVRGHADPWEPPCAARLEALADALLAGLGVDEVARRLGRSRVDVLPADVGPLDVPSAVLDRVAEGVCVALASGDGDDARLGYVNRGFRHLLGLEELDDRSPDELHALVTGLGLPPELLEPGPRMERVADVWLPVKGLRHMKIERHDLLRVRGPGRRRRLWMLSFLDVTGATRAQTALETAFRQARSAQEASSQLLSNVSHEMRTPLNAILGFAELLRMDADDASSEHREELDEIRSAGEHLLGLVEDLLEHSRLQAGRRALDEEDLDLVALVGEVLGFLAPVAQQARVELATSLPPALGLRGDRRALRQVVVNLVGNALKFTPPGGVVTVALSPSDAPGEVVLRITDTGVGIPLEHLERVFEPFVQVDPSSTRAHQGAGLGLALVRALVELHGGRVRLTSPPGRGTTAEVQLPERRRRSS